MSSRKTPLDASLHRIAKLGYVLTGALLTTTILGASPAAATTPCASLTGVTVPTSVTNLVGLPATTIPPTTINSAVDTPASSTTPEFCNVLATVGNDSNPGANTSIQIQLPMPNAWQNRYLHLGGAGFDGSIPTTATAPASFNVNFLAEGIAVGASNGGHSGAAFPGPLFAGNQTLVLGYAWTALEYTDVVAQALIEAFYGKPAKFRYFDGCSNGGKNASVAAGRLGNNYDGVIGGDGVWGHSNEDVGGSDTGGLSATWARVVSVTAPLNPATLPAKLTALYNAELAACDALDGLADGIISNPTPCVFHPEQLACPTGTDTTSCLNPQEVAALKTLRSDLLFNGKVIGAPYTEGNMGAGLSAIVGGGAGLGGGFLDFAFNNPAFLLSSFNLEKDYKLAADQLDNNDYMDGSVADISKYLNKGGKLIVWHAREDALIPVKASIRFVERLQQSLDATGAANLRLYTPPAVNHCMGGNGADSFDLVTPMIEWVEHGTAPTTLLASKVVSNVVTFTRPLCVYPKYPKFINGNANEASSFECVAP
jgi:feruloyl esterase